MILEVEAEEGTKRGGGQCQALPTLASFGAPGRRIITHCIWSLPQQGQASGSNPMRVMQTCCQGIMRDDVEPVAYSPASALHPEAPSAPACKSCRQKSVCTKNSNGRFIDRSEYVDIIEANNL